jgi:hypothetical protein
VTLGLLEGGGAPSLTRSVVTGLSTQGLRGVHGEITYRLKDTVVTDRPTIGDSVLTLRGGHQRPSGLTMNADLSRRLSGPVGAGPTSLELTTQYPLKKQWELGGGLRLDTLEDTDRPDRSYKARVVWGSATMVF